MNRKSTKRLLGAMVLSFESFVAFFATLAGFGLKVAPAEWVWGIGLGFAVLLIITPAFLGKPGGYAFGWILQAAPILSGFLLLQAPIVPSGFWIWGMVIIGAIFAGLWAWAMLAGGTIDKARANLEKMNAGELNVN